MDIAERLFGEQGFDATSMRQLTQAANVNLAAVNYHFRSKEGLLQAIFARRFVPMNQSRFRLLDQALAEAEGGKPSLEAVLDALFRPPLTLRGDPSGGGEAFFKLVGRVHTEPGEHVQHLFRQHFDEVERRFVDALRRCLPEMTTVDLLWSGLFSVGAMAHTLCKPSPSSLARSHDIDADAQAIVNRLVRFCAAGFRSFVESDATTEVVVPAGHI